MNRSFCAEFELDFAPFSELFNHYSLGMLSLNFTQNMEVWVQLLGIIFVGVGS